MKNVCGFLVSDRVAWYWMPVLWLGCVVFIGAALLLGAKDWVLRQIDTELEKMP